MKNFFNTIIKSFTSPAFYAEVIKEPFSFSLKFFIFYFFLYTLMATAISLPSLLRLGETIKTIPVKLIAIYPPELEIKITNGEASTSIEKPYYFPLPKIENKFFEEKEPENLLVIDTKANIENFYDYKTMVLLTKKSIVAIDENGILRVYPLTDAPDLTINRQFVENIILKLSPLLKFVVPCLILLIFFALLVILPAANLLYLLFFSLIGLLMAKILSLRISYKKMCQIGLHLILIPTTVFGALQLFNIHLSFPFLKTLMMTVLAAIALNEIKKAEATAV